MAIPRRPFIYRPDEHFEFGLLGEQPVTMYAWIDNTEPDKLPLVHIVAVKMNPTFANEYDKDGLDITGAILSQKHLLNRYKEEIAAEYLKRLNKEWDD